MSKVVTGRVRGSYVYLINPRIDDNGKSKYSITVLLPKSDMQTKAAIDAAIAQAIEQGRNGKWNGLVPPNIPTPIKDGDGLRQDGSPFGDECKGHWVFTASTSAEAGRPRPQILGPDFQNIIDPSEIYSGMYCRVSVNFAPYFSAGKKGVGCYLNHVQKLEDGEPLGATKASAEDDFGASPIPQYQAPAQNQYPMPQGQYQQTMQYNQSVQQYQQPMQYNQSVQQYQQPMAQPQIDPFTGLPINGGVMGL